MKIMIFLLSSIFIHPIVALADDPCNSSGFRQKYSSMCVEIPVPASRKEKGLQRTRYRLAPEHESLKEKIDCPFFGSCLSAARKVIQEKAAGVTNIGRTNTITEAVEKQRAVSSKLEAIEKQRVNLQKSAPESDKDIQNRFLDSLPKGERAAAEEGLAIFNSGDIAACSRNPNCANILPKIDAFKDKVESKKEQEAQEIQGALSEIAKVTQKNQDDLRKKVRGPFLDDAIDRLNSINGISVDKSTFASVCQNILFNETTGSSSNNPGPKGIQQAKKQCQDLDLGKDLLSDLADEYEKIEDKIENEQNIANLLGLKLGIQKGNARQQALANKALMNKVNDKLEDTVLGKYMDQMRADMCAVAQNKDMMCGGSVLPENFVNDSSKAIFKQSLERVSEGKSPAGSSANAQ